MSARSRRIGVALAATLLLTAAGVVTYRTVFFGDWAELSGGYDVYRAQGPYAYYLDYCLHEQHVFPLWNPLTLCGMPYAANPVTAAFYPPNLLRSLLTFHPTPFKSQLGWAIMIGLHLLWAGLGIFFLARRYRLTFSASILAALLFMFSAIWIRRVGEYHFINMVSWLPWLLLINLRALAAGDWRRRVRLGCGAGILLGIALLAGTMNIAPYLVCTCVAHAVFTRFLFPRAEALRNCSRARVLGGDVLYGGTALIVGLLVAAALLAPGMELAAHSGRSNDANQRLAAPHYGGTPEKLYHDLVRFPGTQWAVEDIRGFGVAGLLLVLAGLAYRRWRVSLLCVLLFLLLFDLAMGPPWPLSRIFYGLAPFQMIGSNRAFDFALLPLALLAAAGLDALGDRTRSRWGRVLLSVTLAGAGFVFLRTLLGLIGPDTFLAPGLAVVVLPAIAAGIMVLTPWTPGRLSWAILLVVLVFAETAVWNGKYVPRITTRKNFTTWAGVFPGGDPFWPDNRRGVDHVQNRHLYALRPAMHGYDPVHLRAVRRVLAGDARGRRYQRSVKDNEITQENHRGNLFLKRAFWLARQYVDGPLRGKDTLFPAATTVFLQNPGKLAVPRVAASEVPPVALSNQARRMDYLSEEALAGLRQRVRPGTTKRVLNLPIINLPPQYTVLCLTFQNTGRLTCESVFRDPDTGQWQRGKRARIAPRRRGPITLQLPLPDFVRLRPTITFALGDPGAKLDLKEVFLLADDADEDRHIRVLSRTANEVSLLLEDLPGYRILSFFDAAYPGWQAFIDGKPVPILLANDAFKAVEIPPGTHYARFVYRPVRVYAGVAVTLSSCILALFAMVGLRPSGSTH